jgi:hypothetical protein
MTSEGGHVYRPAPPRPADLRRRSMFLVRTAATRDL